jgi:hypothetical protein
MYLVNLMKTQVRRPKEYQLDISQGIIVPLVSIYWHCLEVRPNRIEGMGGLLPIPKNDRQVRSRPRGIS